MSSPSLSAYKLAPEHIDNDIDPNDIVPRELRFLVPAEDLNDEQLEEHARSVDKGVRMASVVETIRTGAVDMVKEYDDFSEHNSSDAVRLTAEEALSRLVEDAQRQTRGINVAAGPINVEEDTGTASVELADPAWTTYQELPVDPLLDEVITRRQILRSPEQQEVDKLPFVSKVNAVLYHSDAYNALRSKARYPTSVALFVDLADNSLALVNSMDDSIEELQEVQRELANLSKKVAQVGGKIEKRQREVSRHRAKLCEYGAMEEEVKVLINEVYLKFFRTDSGRAIPNKAAKLPRRHTKAHCVAVDALLESYYHREEEEPVASSLTQHVGRASSPLDHERLRRAFPGNSASDPVTLE